MGPSPAPVLYPKYLDLTDEESARYLRQLELEAYAAMITAMRSQGELNKEKKNLLSEIRSVLCISMDRHRAEVRRAVNDEKLATIALFAAGFDSDMEWKKEGHRMESVPTRPLPITKYMEEADRVAEITARENALLPSPAVTGKRRKSESALPLSPAKSEESLLKGNTGLRSSLYCIKCSIKSADLIDVGTSTGDTTEEKLLSPDSLLAPSASDSFVFLPGGTTVRVEVGNTKKEEKYDAYSFKSSSSGKIDFGSAPEISLTGPRPPKRQRKKSIGLGPSKEMGLSVKQIIRPEKEQKKPSHEGQEIREMPKPEDFDMNDFEAKSFSPVKSTAMKHKIGADTSLPYNQPPKSRRKKTVSHPAAIQHTPVPPEHLYAVGSSSRTKSSHHSHSSASSEVIHDFPVSPEMSMGPLDPHGHGKTTYRFHQRSAPDDHHISQSSLAMSEYSRSITGLSDSHNFQYSPSKPFFQTANLSQSYPGKPPSSITSKRYRFSSKFSAGRRKALTVGPLGHQSMLKVPISGESKPNLMSVSEVTPTCKIFHPSSYTSDLYRNPNPYDMREAEAGDIKLMEPRKMVPHTSTLDDLASVSLVAPSLVSNTIVETGLAPVSAIVSRVASPAPSPLPTLPEKPMSHPAVVSGPHMPKSQPGQKNIIVVHKLGKQESTTTSSAVNEESKPVTSAKNVPTPTVNPKPLSKVHSIPISESALGSIQGLVSGLNPTTAIMKSAKFAGLKPEFITTPVHKKAVVGKLNETTAKVIKVIGGPGKVQIRTSTVTTVPATVVPSQLRTIQGGRIVKPIPPVSSTGYPKPLISSPGTSTNIISAAFSQAVGAPIVSSSPETGTLVSLGSMTSGNKSIKDGSPGNGIIKVATSTPAASTIRAFAATYKKNSSTPPQKQMLSLSTIQKSIPSTGTLQTSQTDKGKLLITESVGHSKQRQMLFTPNQPQLHRTHVATFTTVKTTNTPSAARLVASCSPSASVVSSMAKPMSKVPYRVAYQQSSQQMPMKVKVLAQPVSTSKPSWRATSVLGQTTPSFKDSEESKIQAKIFQDMFEPISSGVRDNSPKLSQSRPTSDRATFIYQYHSTPNISQTSAPGPILLGGKPTVTTAVPATLTRTERDVITLHSVATEGGPSREGIVKQTVQAQSVRPNLVKINLQSVKSEVNPVLMSEQGSTVKVVPSHAESDESAKMHPPSFPK